MEKATQKTIYTHMYVMKEYGRTGLLFSIYLYMARKQLTSAMAYRPYHYENEG